MMIVIIFWLKPRIISNVIFSLSRTTLINSINREVQKSDDITKAIFQTYLGIYVTKLKNYPKVDLTRLVSDRFI